MQHPRFIYYTCLWASAAIIAITSQARWALTAMETNHLAWRIVGTAILAYIVLAGIGSWWLRGRKRADGLAEQKFAALMLLAITSLIYAVVADVALRNLLVVGHFSFLVLLVWKGSALSGSRMVARIQGFLRTFFWPRLSIRLDDVEVDGQARVVLTSPNFKAVTDLELKCALLVLLNDLKVDAGQQIMFDVESVKNPDDRLRRLQSAVRHYQGVFCPAKEVGDL